MNKKPGVFALLVFFLITITVAAGCGNAPAMPTATMIIPSPSASVATPTAGPAPTEVPGEDDIHFVLNGPDSNILDLYIPYIEGATAFSLLRDMCVERNLALGFKGSPERQNVYIYSVAGYSERDYSSTSGWIYLVNDIMLPLGSASYKMQPGDCIEWRYVK